jgi:4'-phosphopantetheinyl transferase EntD
MPELALLTATLRAMLPAGAGVGAALASGDHALWPGEALARAVLKRQREFAAGRAAARAALADIGAAAVALPRRPDRAPEWPAGVAGSISHSDDVALAAVVRGGPSPGIDVEPDADLPANVVGTILSEAERATLGSLRLARVVFSVKESFFKAQHPRTGQMIGFDAAQVALTRSGFALTVAHSLPGLPAGTRLSGHWAACEGHILTALVIA